MSTQYWFPRNRPRYAGTPTVVNNHVAQYTSGSSFDYTPTFTPTVGNLLVMIIGGTAVGTGGTLGVTAPAGWTRINGTTAASGGVPLAAFYKLVTASESTPYTFGLDGGRTADNILIRCFEIQGANPDNSIEWVQDHSGGNVSSTTGPSFDVGYRGLLITATAHGSSSLWTNSWGSGLSNTGSVGSTQRTQVGWRNVTAVTINEAITWATGGAAVSVRFTAFLIREKTIYP